MKGFTNRLLALCCCILVSGAFSLQAGLTVENAPAVLTRGPYLQIGTPGSVIIRWKTDLASDSKVRYGLSVSSLSLTVTDTSKTTEHIVSLTGLSPQTKYYYSIGSSQQVLQGDANNFFSTSPAPGSSKKTTIWAVGDCGTASTNQTNVRNSYQSYMGGKQADVWLLLGDNAYSNGLDAEFQQKFFTMYPTILKNTILWPAPGNHDYANNSTRQNDHDIPYYSIFSLPTQAEAGGVVSNTEAFYSFNYSNIHFLSLDSYGKEQNSYRLYDTLGPQVVWIKKDLAANTRLWTVAYWHHPPYTKGSHNSDTEQELINMRQNFIRILERYKVDLVLCGHSHSYERSFLLKGHYGLESTFNSTQHALSSSSAKYDGSASSCPYIKNNQADGTVYVVAGSAGQLGGTASGWPHNAMSYSNETQGGSLVLEVDSNRLDAKWVCADGIIRDKFTLFKNVNKKTSITITPGDTVNLMASWKGKYLWSPGGDTLRTLRPSPLLPTTYIVYDNLNCLSDTFIVNVNPTLAQEIGSGLFSFRYYPNPAGEEISIDLSLPEEVNVSMAITDLSGRNVYGQEFFYSPGKHHQTLSTLAANISPGVYFIHFTYLQQRFSGKVFIH